MGANNRKLFINNPDEFILNFGGIIEGFAKGQWGNFSPKEDIFNSEGGTDGEVVITRNNDPTATFELTLQQTSPSNDILSVAMNAAMNAPNMVGGILPFSLVNLNGRDYIKALNAAVKRVPDKGFSSQVMSIKWTIELFDFSCFFGGGNVIGINP